MLSRKTPSTQANEASHATAALPCDRLKLGLERALELHQLIDELAREHPSYELRLARAEILGAADALADLLREPSRCSVPGRGAPPEPAPPGAS